MVQSLIWAMSSALVLSAILTFSTTQAKRTLWIHIGPLKTASTHLQTFGLKYEKEFANAGIDWIQKSKRNLAFDLYVLFGMVQHKQEHDKTLSEILRKNEQSGNDMILSLEELSIVEPSSITRIRQEFRDYDVRVIFIYRDPMSQLLSFYNQANKGSGERRLTYSLASEILGVPRGAHGGNIIRAGNQLDHWTEVFGHDSITIVDMAGSALTGDDIAYTVFCKVMGVLCNKPELFKNVELGKNGHQNLTMMQVNSFFVSYLANANVNFTKPYDRRNIEVCQYCSSNYASAARWFESWYTKNLLAKDQIKYKIPIVTANLSMLIPYMDNMVSEVFDKYGDRILHGDKPAILLAIRKYSLLETLDCETFFDKLPWVQIFEQAMEDGNKGLLCNCNNTF